MAAKYEQRRGLRVECIASLKQCVLRVPRVLVAPNSRGLTNPPGFVRDGSQYITITGSISYGTNDSDFDTVGFCIPPKEMVLPHLAGEIPAFGRQLQRFDVWEHHHCFDADALGRGRTYDFNVYSIVKFFQLAMDNNPNMLRRAVHAARVRGSQHEGRRHGAGPAETVPP